MKIVIITVGSLGDAAPFIGLGVRLRAAGHEVSVAAQTLFEAPIRDAGLEFRKMPGDVRAGLASEDGRRMHRATSWWRALPATYRFAEKVLSDLAEGIVAAAEGAELLVLHRVALMHGYVVANAMGIPFLLFELFPSGLAPTAEFLPAAFGGGSLGAWGNRAVYRLMRACAGKSKKYAASLDAFQKNLGVRRIGGTELLTRMESERWPIYHAFSAAVVPRPRDFREGLEIIGYLWPATLQDWQPPRVLTDFIGAGTPPVFVGFGSLIPEESERIFQLVASAVRRAQVRAVVQSGWGDLGGAAARREDDAVLSIGSVPHDWLFPKVAAVVHAASAGVTAAALRAGVPAVPIPAMNDQPFWANRLVKLGVSPGIMRFQKLSAEGLGNFIQQAVSQPSYRAAARAVAARMETEDAAGSILQIIESIADRGLSAKGGNPIAARPKDTPSPLRIAG